MNHSVKRRRQALHQTHNHYYLNIRVEAANLSDWRIESNRKNRFGSENRIESKLFCPNWKALLGEDPSPSFFKVKFYFKNIKFYHANQCVPRRHKNKHWSEWATFDVYRYALEYKAPLISASTNFLQPSQNLKLVTSQPATVISSCKLQLVCVSFSTCKHLQAIQ